MLFKLLLIAILVYIVIFALLNIMLPDIDIKLIIKLSIILTGLFSIAHIMVCEKSNLVENFEGIDIEEEASKNTDALEDKVSELIGSGSDERDEPTQDIDSSIAKTTNGGLTEQKTSIETAEQISTSAPELEETAVPLQVETTIGETELEKELEKKYTILPVDQWVKPSAKDIIKSEGCMCQDIANFRDGYAPY